MNKASTKKGGTLRPEYDLSRLKGGVRGKYHRQATAGTNLVLVDPELAEVFPDTESVNRALRLLVDIAKIAAPSTRSQHRASRKQPKQTSRKRTRSAMLR